MPAPNVATWDRKASSSVRWASVKAWALVPAVGILVLGLAMRDGPFRRSVASLGVVTGIAGMVSVIGGFVSDIIGVGAILTSILTTVWVAFVGYRMVRLTTRGRSSSPGA